MTSEQEKQLDEHWDKIYLNTPEEKLGWYETDHTHTVRLISKTQLDKSARILIVGAGSTTLIDELLTNGYDNLIATDLSEVALDNLKKRIGDGKVEYIIDDLTKPTKLLNQTPVDLWIDRAVLHFFTEKKDQDTYFELLHQKVKSEGYVLFAEYNLEGAKVCAGLPVHRYSMELLTDQLGPDFNLVASFDHTYIMPSGNERPYIYALFQRR